MKRKHLLIFGLSCLLMGCSKTDILYKKDAYNSPVFEENYYTDYDGLNIADFTKLTDTSGALNKIEADGVKKNMSSRNPEYAKGVLSKLYDGRLECGGLFQLSRVQLNKEGFGTRLPEMLNINKFQFSVRGGTTCAKPLRKYLDFDYFINIYTKNGYYEFLLDGNRTPVDNDSETYKFELTFANSNNNVIKDVIGYSLTWDCSEFSIVEGVAPDDEIALMLYEVVLE